MTKTRILLPSLITVALLALLLYFMPTQMAEAKGNFATITISGGDLPNDLEVTDPALLEFFSFSYFPDAHIDPLDLEGGYLITRSFKLENASFEAWDSLRYFPSNGEANGYVYYNGLVNGSSEYDHQWYRASTEGDLTLRTILATNVRSQVQSSLGQVGEQSEFRVTSTQPSDESEGVNTNSQIVVVFNRPVVNLVGLADQDELPQPLTIEPALEGSGQWLNTSIYVFTPKVGLAGGESYTIFVADLETINGESLAAPFRFSFTTAQPIVTASDPTDFGSFVRPDAIVHVTFSQPMDRASSEAAFSLRNVRKNEQVTGDFSWDELSTSLTFTPSQALDFGTQYRIKVINNAMPASQQGTLERQYTASFTTSPLPEVEYSSPVNNDKGVAPDTTVTIRFNTNMSATTVLDNIRFTPEITATQVYSYYSEWDRQLTLSWNKAPQTAYLVTIGAAAEDLFGNQLGEEFTLSFKTGDYSPFVQLDIDRFTHYSAFTKTRTSVLYRNVKAVNVNLFQLPLRELYKLTGENQWQIWDTYSVPDTEENLIWNYKPEVSNERNVSIRQVVSLTKESGDTLSPGIYLIETGLPTDVKSPQGDTVQNQKSRGVVVLSNYNLVIKKAEQGQTLAWLTDLRTGQPVADKVVNFVSNGKPVGEATTNENGIATLSLTLDGNFQYLPVLAIVGQPGDEEFALTASDWSNGIASWDFNLPGGSYADRYTMYFYTDRPIYRPGQSVYWKGIVREMLDDDYQIPDPDTEVKVKINDGFGNLVSEESFTPNDLGTLNGKLDLSTEAVTGFYYLEANIQYGEERTAYGSAGFQVAAYRKPEFEISLSSDKPEYIQGDRVKLTVQASYFSGGPLSNAPVTWQLLSDPYSFNWPNPPKAWADRWFSFTPFDPDSAEYDPYAGARYGLVKEGTGSTDAKGNFVIEVPADLAESLQSQRWSFNVTIQSSTNQFVNESTAIVIHRGQFYIGISPASYVAEVGQSSTVDLVTIDPQGKAVGGIEMQVVISEFNWNSVYERGADGSYNWSTSVERRPIFTSTATTSADGHISIDWTPEKGGQYQVVAQGEDLDGNRISSAGFQWVSEEDSSHFIAWPRRNNDRIDLIADKRSYKPGDSARILVTNPFTGTVKALLTLERAGVLESKLIEIAGSSNTLRIPINEAHIPNIYVSLVLIKGIDEVNPVPAMRVGYTQLAVDTSSKALDIEIESSTEIAKPGETVTYTLSIQDKAGKPAANSEVSVALVDKAVLTLAQADNRKLLDIFYYQRALGVTTGATLIINKDRMSQQLSEGAKGGGGGGGGGLEVRQDFPDIAYWRAELVSDDEGKVVFSVDLPDNLTTWALAVKAINAESQVGEAVNEIVATKELQIRPLLPRFFTAGDRAKIGATLINTTDEATGDLRFALEVAGAVIETDATTLQTDLAAGEQKRFDFPISVNAQATSVVVTMTAITDRGSRITNLNDAIVMTLPVVRYITPETVATAGTVTAEGRSEGVVLPPEATGEAEVEINLEASLVAGMIDGLDYLEHYAYECNEQTTSRFLPNLFTVRALRSLNIDDRELENKLTFQLGVGINRLLSRQNPDGGWGYWPGGESQSFITAYVLWGLTQARQMDYPIDAFPRDRAADFLERAFVAPAQVTENWKLNEMAFIHFVLAEMGKGDPSRASTLFDERARMSNYGKAYLAMALHSYGSSNGGNGDGSFESQVQTLADDLLGAANLSATTASWQEGEVDYWTMNTDTRSTAIVLAALTRIRPQDALLPNAVRWLMEARKAGRWANTQENAWSIIALTDWMTASGELEAEYDWSVELNGKTLGSGSFGPDNIREKVHLRAEVSDLLKNAANELSFKRSSDSGQLYYTTYLRYTIDALAVQAKDRGLVVDRRFELDGAVVSNAQVGDVISVTVTIIAPRDMYHVLIEAPIPAGTEPIDPRLQTESQLLDESGEPMLRPIDALGDSPWFYWSPSYTDVRDDKVALFATYLRAGTYEYTFKVRATVPGEYRVLPVYGEMMYFTEVWGRSSGAQFTVRE